MIYQFTHEIKSFYSSSSYLADFFKSILVDMLINILMDLVYNIYYVIEKVTAFWDIDVFISIFSILTL